MLINSVQIKTSNSFYFSLKLVNSKPNKGQHMNEIVEYEEEPTLSKLINKLIRDAIEIDELSSQLITKLETFFFASEKYKKMARDFVCVCFNHI